MGDFASAFSLRRLTAFGLALWPAPGPSEVGSRQRPFFFDRRWAKTEARWAIDALFFFRLSKYNVVNRGKEDGIGGKTMCLNLLCHPIMATERPCQGAAMCFFCPSRASSSHRAQTPPLFLVGAAISCAQHDAHGGLCACPSHPTGSERKSRRTKNPAELRSSSGGGGGGRCCKFSRECVPRRY